MKKNTIPISEIFIGIQGEGSQIGTPTVFVRVYGCNMASMRKGLCPWCDSLYAVNENVKHTNYISHLTVDEIVKKIQEFKCKDVTFTGGEPFLYIDKIDKIIKKLWDIGDYDCHFETNGIIFPENFKKSNGGFEVGISYVISPKLHAINDQYIKSLTLWANLYASTEFKFVYENNNTIKQINNLIKKIPKLKNYQTIYLMPEGVVFDAQIYDECAKQCIIHGFKLGARLHNIIWGNVRGK